MASLTVVAQNDLILKYTVTDQDGDAVSLTGATIKWSIRRDLETLAALEKTTSAGIAITDAAGGVFQVTITDTETENLTKRYVMEATIIDVDGFIYTITTDDIEADTITFRPIYTSP